MGDAGELSISSRDSTSNYCFEPDTYLKIPPINIVSFALAQLEHFDPQQVIFAEANDPRNCVVAGEVAGKVKRIVTWLESRGLEVGDCVCIHSYNSIWYPLLWLAVIAAGGVVTGSNPAYTSAELLHHLKITNARFVVAQDVYTAAVKEAVSAEGALASNIFILGINDDLSNELHKHELNEEVLFDNTDTQETTIAVCAATSGTTGLPKAAELPHKYFVTQTSILENIFLKRKDEVRQLVCLPIFHAFAAQLSIILPLRLGITTYFMPRFTLPEYTHHVARFQITDSPVVPQIIGTLLGAPRASLKSLRYLVCAGAPMTASVQNKLYANLHPSAIIAQCWGATELGWITCFTPFERDQSGSVGRLLPNTLLKLVNDSDDLITTDNTPGEARVYSQSVFKRYRGNPYANAVVFDSEGFYRTGDRVYVSDGKIFICGRIKDVLKVNGWQVSPEEIERVILDLDDIADCAVIGHTVVGYSGLEEIKPRAFVVRKSGSQIREADVKEHVAKNLIRYKHLSGGVIFLHKLPRSAIGKIQRKLLAELDMADGCYKSASSGSEGLGLFRHHLVAVMLVPLCFALGVPALILLVVSLRQIIAADDRHD